MIQTETVTKTLPANALRCQACGDDVRTTRYWVQGYLVCHCSRCLLTSMIDPVTTVSYDAEYVAERYDRYPTTERMSELRCTFVRGVIGLFDALPKGQINPFIDGNEVLDVGYGNGSFIRRLSHYGWSVFGSDVNPQPYPGVRQRLLPISATPFHRYRCITFFDALEHFEQLRQVRRVSACADWVIVTAPLPPEGFPCDGGWAGGSPLTPWRHWRPGEHQHYLHPETLEHVFSWEDEVAGVAVTATLEHTSHFEDVIRGPGIDGRPNTYTAALRCTTFRGDHG